MLSLDIDARGFGTLGIPDAQGEFHDYHVALVPRGLSAWSLELRRTDADEAYLVRVYGSGKWECSCPAFKYRKRGAECKHVKAGRAFRAFLINLFLPLRESSNEPCNR